MDDLISDNLYQTNSSIIRYLVKKLDIDTIIAHPCEIQMLALASALLLPEWAIKMRQTSLSFGMDRTGHSIDNVKHRVMQMFQILEQHQEDLKLFDHHKRLAMANFLFRVNLCSNLLKELISDPIGFNELKMLAGTY